MIILKILLKNATVVNVFTGTLEKENVLIENDKIIGVGDYNDEDADITEDLSGKFICPGFIDGHIHIESTMLTPFELAKICLPHGTTTIIADPHEIANVCGVEGIEFMLDASQNIPLNVNIMLPSCVPSTPLDESGAILKADDLEPFYQNKRVLGLAEMMNYPGVLFGDADVNAKILNAKKHNRVIDGHAPMVSGKELDKYISAGIQSDHECSTLEEGIERIKKGQWLMIRQGTAAKNLEALLPLFEPPFNHRCVLVTDDRHPSDIINEGHIDNIIRLAIRAGKSPITAIQMATIQCAECFGLKYQGAIAPGYKADLLVLDNLETVEICDVYSSGEKIVNNGELKPFTAPVMSKNYDNIYNSFKLKELSADDFHIEEKSTQCRAIKVIPKQLLTEEIIFDVDWSKANGIDLDRDILKLAVIERHHNTGHKGIGFINGIGLKKGAIASSVSHDSHNLIVIGTNDEDMAIAANRIKSIGGGNVVVVDGEIIEEMPLVVAGLMSDLSAQEIATLNEKVRKCVYNLGVSENVEPFMNMAFVSLLVIPHIKMSTKGLIDVNKQEIVSLYV